MIKRTKYFGKKDLLACGIVMVSSFAVLLAVSFESQFAIAQNPQSMMGGGEMISMNQTSGQDMNMMDMKAMMNMMKNMMNMMNMMMNMSSDMSNSTGMNMSIPMNHTQSGGDNMSMMMMPE